jgi:hypothetical protein
MNLPNHRGVVSKGFAVTLVALFLCVSFFAGAAD